MTIETVELKTIATRTGQYPNEGLSEFLLVGRSNVGKSSFINTIINRKNYARTSATPGKTQTLNFYLVNNNFYLIDVPGYGYAKTSKSNIKKFGLMIEEYIKTRDSLKCVFLLIDFRHKPTEDDLLMLNYLNYFNIPVIVVATKYDKVNKNARSKQEKKIKEMVKIKDTDGIVYFSSISKKGKEEIYKYLEQFLED